MSISVEDWDDLSQARRRRDERAELVYTPPSDDDLEAEPAAAAAPSRLTAVPAALPADTGEYLEDEAYDGVVENLRLPASIAGANGLAWAAGRLTGVVELIGLAFFVSIVLLIAAYLLREWQRDRTALICLAGALPLPVTIISYFA